ncbi:MAG: TetR/AcrR family transcriptional regulator [Rubrobacteraceae bacterium]
MVRSRTEEGPAEGLADGAELPVIGEPRPERADAARNRRRLLEAAEWIMAERGVEGLLMNDVAEAAGVGVGTLYRRFGDRGGLARALLDEQGRQFQAAFLYGPPPLGPGATPMERIRAFLHAWAEELDEQAALMLMADTATPIARARYQTGAYRTYRAHMLTLIRQARPEADAGYLAEALLAPLAADLYVYQRREQGMSIERIKSGLDEVLRCLL